MTASVRTLNRRARFCCGMPSLTRRASTNLGVIVLLLLGPLTGCGSVDPKRVQGYVEGEYVYVSSPLAGKLETLSVRRGEQVSVGAPLFALDSVPEKAARDEAERKLAMNRANWEDLKKGKRPSEIESLEAQLKQAKAALALAQLLLERQGALVRSNSTAQEEWERANTAVKQDRQRVTQLEADLRTAQLGARPDQIAAAEASTHAAEAALARVEWDLAQKRQSAPQGGVVFDTLFRPGEWVPAGRPIVSLLPPANVKVRAFVPQTQIGTVRLDQAVRVSVDGVDDRLLGRVSFISPQAEFTPPVIYSRENRAKLVFKIEIVFDPNVGERLHPGQPVDVYLEP
jgi:HlyD family secretion protein